jgi:hypothetical protein
MQDFDYYLEMKADNSGHWFVNIFLYYLEEGSLTILANASYHSTITDTKSRKSGIQEWL